MPGMKGPRILETIAEDSSYSPPIATSLRGVWSLVEYSASGPGLEPTLFFRSQRDTDKGGGGDIALES